MTIKLLRQSVTTVAFAGILAMSPLAAFAQSPSSTVSGGLKRTTANLSTIITKGDQAISQRLANLNTFLANINAAKRLKSEDKAQYLANINADITGLTTLKAKLDADTDATTARADVKSIYLTYRVYAVFDPQTHELAAADTMTTTADQLDTLANKLESRINEASNGHDVTQLKTWLVDMRAKTLDARTQYGNVESSVSSLTPNSFNTNPTGTKTTLQTAHSQILTGRTDLKAAVADAKQIVAQIKSFKVTGTTPSTSPAPTH